MTTLKKLIIDIGDNAYVNLDPANLILHGMAHPLDAVEILGEYVRVCIQKMPSGLIVMRGWGLKFLLERAKSIFPLLIPRLKEKGFKGPITIEREISGEQQKEDILEAKKFLQPYL